MDELIAGFPGQLAEALQIGQAAHLRPLEGPVSHVYVAGIGGSGIGADIVASLIRDECKFPFLVGKGYQVPAFVGPETLAIASSYSGNTEETLMASDQIRRQGARLISVASGGKLIANAQADGLDYVQLPPGSPSPRACLGYSLTVQLFILHRLGLLGDRTIRSVATSIDILHREAGAIKAEAEKLAVQLHAKTPVIYAEDRMEPVAVRWRQQINENSKALCWHHVIPEMNHNELVGWRESRRDLAVIWLRTDSDYTRNTLRMDINREIIGRYTDTLIDVRAKGADRVEQAMYLIHLGDWVSWYLSALRGKDAIEIEVIDYLKGELGKVPL